MCVCVCVCVCVCAVTFDDDVPKAGFARLILTVREMEVKKPFGGKPKAKNADITASFDNG